MTPFGSGHFPQTQTGTSGIVVLVLCALTDVTHHSMESQCPHRTFPTETCLRFPRTYSQSLGISMTSHKTAPYPACILCGRLILADNLLRTRLLLVLRLITLFLDTLLMDTRRLDTSSEAAPWLVHITPEQYTLLASAHTSLLLERVADAMLWLTACSFVPLCTALYRETVDCVKGLSSPSSRWTLCFLCTY